VDLSSFFGNTLAAGDLDGDGLPDFVLSSPLIDSYRGDVYILLSSAAYQ